MNLHIFYKLKDVVSRNRTMFMGLLFAAVFILFAYLVYKSIYKNYLPIYSDEYGYYLNAKAFQLCGRLGSALTVNEYYSAIGHSSFYGFLYSLFYGTFFKILALFGVTPSIMVVNILLTLLLFVSAAFINISLEKKFYIGTVFLSNYVFILYLSSSMTEIFHFIISVIIAYLLYMIYKTHNQKYIYYLLLLLMIVSLSRPPWIFVLFGLFPLSNSFKGFLKYLLLLLSGFVYLILIEKYLYAPYPFSYMHNFLTYMQSNPMSDALRMLYDHFLSNLDNYFISVGYGRYRFVFYYKYLFVIVMLYSFFAGARSRSKSLLSASIIALVFFSSLMVMYDAYDWREVRVLAAPFMLLVTMLVLNKKFPAVFAIILFQLYTLSAVLDHKYDDDSYRAAMDTHIAQNKELLKDFTQFEEYVPSIKKKNILILLERNLLPPNVSPLNYQLPLRYQNKCISYSIIMHGKFKVANSKSDLFISRHPVKIKNMKLLGHNNNFYFYKNMALNLF